MTISVSTRLALVAIVLLMIAGCAGYRHGHGERGPSFERVVPEVNQMVEQNVKDPEKAKQVKALLQEIVAEVKKSSQQTRGFHEQLNVLNANYDAKPEQFTKVLDEMNNARMTSATKILGLRFKIKDLLTAQEWKDLTDAMAKARSRYERPAKTESMY